jgi:hypothetical protein
MHQVIIRSSVINLMPFLADYAILRCTASIVANFSINAPNIRHGPLSDPNDSIACIDEDQSTPSKCYGSTCIAKSDCYLSLPA